MQIYSHSFSVYLVTLVDAVDELRVRGCPGEAYCGGVDGLCFHIAWSDGGNWLTGKMENGRQRRKQMRLLFFQKIDGEDSLVLTSQIIDGTQQHLHN